jgi:hypothetical protein
MFTLNVSAFVGPLPTFTMVRISVTWSAWGDPLGQPIGKLADNGAEQQINGKIG